MPHTPANALNISAGRPPGGEQHTRSRTMIAKTFRKALLPLAAAAALS